MYVMTTCSEVSTFAHGSSEEAAVSLDELSEVEVSAAGVLVSDDVLLEADVSAAGVSFVPELESLPPQPTVNPASIVVVNSNANTFFFIFCPPIILLLYII